MVEMRDYTIVKKMVKSEYIYDELLVKMIVIESMIFSVVGLKIEFGV